MAKVRSVLEYDVIPFNKVDLNTPITQIVEMNDGYQILVAGDLRKRIYDSDSQDERGGIQVNAFASLRDFLMEECGAVRQPVPADETLAEELAQMSRDGDPVMGGGVIQLKKLSGKYRDPEALFMSFFDPDEDDEDEDEDRSEGLRHEGW